MLSRVTAAGGRSPGLRSSLPTAFQVPFGAQWHFMSQARRSQLRGSRGVCAGTCTRSLLIPCGNHRDQSGSAMKSVKFFRTPLPAGLMIMSRLEPAVQKTLACEDDVLHRCAVPSVWRSSSGSRWLLGRSPSRVGHEAPRLRHVERLGDRSRSRIDTPAHADPVGTRRQPQGLDRSNDGVVQRLGHGSAGQPAAGMRPSSESTAR